MRNNEKETVKEKIGTHILLSAVESTKIPFVTGSLSGANL